MKLLLLLLLLTSTPASVAQLRSDLTVPPDPETAVLPDTLPFQTSARAGLFATIDGLGLGNGLLRSEQLGGTIGYRFENGLEVGAGLHRTSAYLGSAYMLGVIAGYTHSFSPRSGIRTTARLTSDFNNLYEGRTDDFGFQSYQLGSHQLRMLRADVDVAAFHRIDLTRWMSLTPSAGVFATGTRNVNRDALAHTSEFGSTGLFLGLHTGLDLTFRLSDKVSLTLPFRLRLFPQQIVSDGTAPAFQEPTLGTGIRLDF